VSYELCLEEALRGIYLESFNIIDAFITAFLTVWAIQGYRRGFLLSATGLTAFVASIYLSFKTYPILGAIVANVLNLPVSFADLASFLIIFAISHFAIGVLLYRPLYSLSNRLHKGLFLGGADRFFGVLPSTIGGIIWLSIILGIIVWFPINEYLKDLVITSSMGTPIVDAAAVMQPQAEEVVGKAIEDATKFADKKDTREEWKPNIPPDVRVRFDADAEKYMLTLVNSERAPRDLKILDFHPTLRDVARSHSMDMVKNNFFDHKSPTTGHVGDRLLSAGFIYISAGENLAFAGDVEIAHMLLMESQGHRENLLNRSFGRAGIGIVDAGPYGYMCTQVFTN